MNLTYDTSISTLFTQLSNHAISKKIIGYPPKIQNPSINYLKLELEKDDIQVSYLDSNGLDKIAVYNRYNNTTRKKTKLGRIIKKIIPDATDDAIRTFVEEAKAMYCGEYKCFLAPAEDIFKWYSVNCKAGEGSKWACKGTSLANACFQKGGANTQPEHTFNLFKANSDKFGIIICTYEDKLDGRTLVWHGKASGKNVSVHDRIYVGSPQALIHIKAFAKDNNIIDIEDDAVKRSFKSELVYDTHFQYFDYLRVTPDAEKKTATASSKYYC